MQTATRQRLLAPPPHAYSTARRYAGKHTPQTPTPARQQPASTSGLAEAFAAANADAAPAAAEPAALGEMPYDPRYANSVSLIGNLGSDPNAVQLPSGDSVVNLSLAFSQPKGGTGWCAPS